jgi:hypothetical protein
VPGGAIVPWLACAVIAWMLTAIRASEWAAFALTLTAAAAFFTLSRRRRLAEQRATA